MPIIYHDDLRSRRKPVSELHMLGRIALRDRSSGHCRVPLSRAHTLRNVGETSLRHRRLYLRVQMPLGTDQLQQEVRR